MKRLYSIPEVGNYWFAIYHTHYKNKLEMKKSIYNLCHFYSSGLFVIIRMQTDDIFILAYNDFARKKEALIQIAKIMTKD